MAGEAFDIYFRDVVECIRALFGDPEYAPYLVFVPERHYADEDRTVRLYHDMHTGKWWWSTQVCNLIVRLLDTTADARLLVLNIGRAGKAT